MFIPFPVLRARLAGMIETKADQGRDVSGLTSELGTTPDDYQALFELSERIDRASRLADWKYVEPSDLEQIRAERAARPQTTGATLCPDSADRARAGFLASVAGCVLGKPVEIMPDLAELRAALERLGEWPLSDYISERLVPDGGLREFNEQWQESVRERIAWVPADDDINYTLLGMMALEQHGADFTLADLRRLWLDNLPLGWTWGPERTFLTKQGLAMGVEDEPPMDLDAMPATQNPWDELCGAMIRADAFGYACPGDPVMASELAWRDASLTHRGNGIYGAMFAAAAIAAAFTHTDGLDIARVALTCVPARSRFHAIVEDSIRHVEESTDWLDAYARIHGGYGEYGHCRVFQETGTLVNTLHYARDAGEGICMQVMQGNDTDSYGATAGAILGVMHGAGSLPGRWLEPFHDVIHTRLAGYYETSLTATADRVAALTGLFHRR